MYKPIKNKDIKRILNEVSDNGDQMSKDLIAGKLNRIKTVLEELEDEEEMISE